MLLPALAFTTSLPRPCAQVASGGMCPGWRGGTPAVEEAPPRFPAECGLLVVDSAGYVEAFVLRLFGSPGLKWTVFRYGGRFAPVLLILLVICC